MALCTRSVYGFRPMPSNSLLSVLFIGDTSSPNRIARSTTLLPLGRVTLACGFPVLVHYRAAELTTVVRITTSVDFIAASSASRSAEGIVHTDAMRVRVVSQRQRRHPCGYDCKFQPDFHLRILL